MPSWFTLSLCLVISFLYTGLEAGLLSLNRARLLSKMEAGDKSAIRLQGLLARPEQLLATVLIVTNFADVIVLIIIAQHLVKYFGTPWGYFMALVVLLPLYLLGVQLLSKTLFRRFPYRALAKCAGLLEATQFILKPVLALGAVFIRWLLPKKDGERPAYPMFVAYEEIRSFTDEGERAGALTSGEHRMIHRILDFRHSKVKALMRPFPNAFVLKEDATVEDVIAFVLEGRKTHKKKSNSNHELAECVPIVLPEKPPTVVALLSVFHLLLEKNKKRPLQELLRRKPVLVAPHMTAKHLMHRMRAEQTEFAAVLDHKKQPVGLVDFQTCAQSLFLGGRS